MKNWILPGVTPQRMKEDLEAGRIPGLCLGTEQSFFGEQITNGEEEAFMNSRFQGTFVPITTDRADSADTIITILEEFYQEYIVADT